jgi:hypothetical protein
LEDSVERKRWIVFHVGEEWRDQMLGSGQEQRMGKIRQKEMDREVTNIWNEDSYKSETPLLARSTLTWSIQRITIYRKTTFSPHTQQLG